MMRIALVHHSLRRGGGMERYLLDLIEGFASAGDTVDVYARRIDAAFAEKLPIKVYPLRAAHWLRPLASTWFARCVPVDELRQTYDHVLTLSRVPGCTAYICGGTHPGYLAATQRHPRLRDRLETRLESTTARTAQVNIAHSRRLAHELAHYYDVGGSTAVIYPPVDTTRFHTRPDAERRAARERYGVTAERKTFLFPSMDHRRKGLDLLLAASAQIKCRHEIVVAGRPPRGFQQSGRLRFLGYVDDMPALYSAVDATVLPSRYEPFGLVIAESLACGTPVIISSDAGVADLIDQDQGILLPDISIDAVANALRTACERRFEIAPSFIFEQGLDRDTHVARIKSILRDFNPLRV